MLQTKYNDPFFDDFFRDFDWLVPTSGKEPRRFPLTDIVLLDNGDIEVDIALAGFSRDDIEIEQVGNTLVISGEVSEKSEKKEKEVIQRHISKSSFERKIRLHDDYVGGDIEASFENGLLKIVVHKNEKDKKLIEIK